MKLDLEYWKLRAETADEAIAELRARAEAAEKERDMLKAALTKIANEKVIDEPFPNENRILHRDDLIKIARAALEGKSS